MIDYPNTRVFLTELLGLDTETAQLPLEILINLHRMEIRGAFNILPHVGARFHGWDRSVLVPTVAKIFDRRYPRLAQGKIYDQAAELSVLRQTFGARFEKTAFPTVLGTANAAHDWLLADFYYSWQRQQWRSWDPALQLFAIVDEGTRDIALPQLELQLGLDPAVSRMLLWLAKVSRAEIEALSPKLFKRLRYDAVEARALQVYLHFSQQDAVTGAGQLVGKTS